MDVSQFAYNFALALKSLFISFSSGGLAIYYSTGYIADILFTPFRTILSLFGVNMVSGSGLIFVFLSMCSFTALVTFIVYKIGMRVIQLMNPLT